MCGRYYVEDETVKEMEKLVHQVDERLKRELYNRSDKQGGKDIYPTQNAPIVCSRQGQLYGTINRWGFPGYQKGQVLFNARSESALEKPTFRESVRSNRIAVPAAWFYEWSTDKEKHIFYQKEYPVFFMAGCSRIYQEETCFVILTTKANASMQPIHDRMPLLLEKEEVVPWILDNSKTEEFLHKKPCELDRRSDYEQISFF